VIRFPRRDKKSGARKSGYRFSVRRRDRRNRRQEKWIPVFRPEPRQDESLLAIAENAGRQEGGPNDVELGAFA